MTKLIRSKLKGKVDTGKRWKTNTTKKQTARNICLIFKIIMCFTNSDLKYNLMFWEEALKKRNLNINMEKTTNYDIGWRGKRRNGSEGHQIGTSKEV